MKLTINIVTDEAETMTATVPEVPGLVVEADDLGEIFAEITDLVPEMTDFDFVRVRNMPKVREPGGAMRQRLAYHAARRKAEAQGIDYDAKMDEFWSRFQADMKDPESVAYKMMAMPLPNTIRDRAI